MQRPPSGTVAHESKFYAGVLLFCGSERDLSRSEYRYRRPIDGILFGEDTSRARARSCAVLPLRARSSKFAKTRLIQSRFGLSIIIVTTNHTMLTLLGHKNWNASG